MTLRRLLLPLLATIAFLAAVTIPTTSRATSTLVPTFATWTSGTTGSLGTVDITVTSGYSTVITPFDLDIPAFDPAGGSSVDMLNTNYQQSGALDIAFSAPVTNLAVYFRYMRGTTQGFSLYEVSPTGTGTWSIESGLSGGGSSTIHCEHFIDISGTTSDYLDGIVIFNGTLTALHIDGPNGTGGDQALTFATLAAPPAPTTTLATTTTAAPSTTVAVGQLSPSFAC